MAKKDAQTVEATETALMLPQAQGTALSMEEFRSFLDNGFASIDTVLIGDPSDGKNPMYVGELLGPGEPIEIANDRTGEVNSLPTWAFHPIVRQGDGTIGPDPQVTDVIPASYVIHAACSRIHKAAREMDKTAQVGIAFVGKTKTRRGFQLNQFRVFEKYVG